LAGAEQALPHVPQSQTPPQLMKPLLQAIPHAPPVHVALPLAGVGHTLPHAPQLPTSALSFTQVPPQLA
jgi:hypothetical protein